MQELKLSCVVAGKLTGDMLCDAGTGEEEVDRWRFHIEHEIIHAHADLRS